MGKPIVIIADTDEQYLETIEKKFIETLDENVEIEIISDISYFEQYFETPKTAELLVVSESMFHTDLSRHNISHIFLLTEEDESGQTADLSVETVYKYLPVKELFNELTYRSREIILKKDSVKKKTEVVSFYSAVGGSGKTTLSLAFADSLAKNHQRVLYINTESVQSFSYYLKDKEGINNDAYRILREEDSMIYQNVKGYLKAEGFEYVPPFRATLDALNIGMEVYVRLIKRAKESGNYDFVVVDIESGFSSETAELLMLADRLIFVSMQDAFSVKKTEWILNNIEIKDKEKCVFLCNRYRSGEKNYAPESEKIRSFPYYMEVRKFETEKDAIPKLAEIAEMQKVAFMFI